jgi:hypothetical protein
MAAATEFMSRQRMTVVQEESVSSAQSSKMVGKASRIEPNSVYGNCVRVSVCYQLHACACALAGADEKTGTSE